ncbi:MAG: hypothetical protein NT126_10720 [Bacteroidetes bacterium]|nr:hypothetical protein [Bacteroidota bacterium]
MDLKKQAERKYGNNDYPGALPLYSQLLSLYPKNPEYNFHYGVCLLLSSHDKAASVSYLETATKFPKLDEEVFFYLGKAYMLTGSFNEALAAFDQFKKRAGSGKIKKLDVDLLISNCKNARELGKNRRNVVIMNQQQVARSSFYSAYVFDSSSGKMLSTPTRFLTSHDKDKIPDPLMFLTRDGQTIYYSSYGKKDDHGKDIYRVTRQPGGDWGEPENLGNTINTENDEDFPFLDHDGRTLYFSSKGHHSIGGYDIFKSVFDLNTGRWSEPENIGIPVNTTEDDLFYVPGFTGVDAQYASTIESDYGKIGVRKIKLGDAVSQLAVINGQYFSEDQPQRRDAKISVIRISDNGLVTTVHTDPRTGKYEIDVPPGDDYTLVVEAGGYLAHAENFSLMGGVSYAELKQKIKLLKNADAERMTMSNYFKIAQQASDPSHAIVSDQPTSEVSNEYRLKDSLQTKLQPVDIRGRIVYVTPPKNVITKAESHDLFEQNVAPVAVNDQKKKENPVPGDSNAEKKSAEQKKLESKSEGTDEKKPGQPVTEKQAVKEEEKNHAAKEETVKTTETKNPEKEKKILSGETQTLAGNKTGGQEKTKIKTEPPAKETKKVQETEPVSKNEPADETAIPENVSNSELAKIAVEDAKSLKAEAEAVMKDADMNRQMASEQDSLAKSQIREAQQMLKEGGKENKEKAKQLLKESEDNSKQANARYKKTHDLEKEANQINSEADESLAEAQVLLKMNKADSSKSSKRKTTGVQHAHQTENDTKENDTANHGEADLINTPVSKEEKSLASTNKTKEEKKKTDTSLSKKEETKKVDAKEKAPVKQGEPENHAPTKNNEQPSTSKSAGGETYSSSKVAESENHPSEKTEPVAVNATKKNEAVTETKSFPAASFKPLPNVAGQAKQSYSEHQQLMNDSKSLALQADDLQGRIDLMPASQLRDSMITKANEMNMESIRKWQQAQEKLNEAKRSDPEVADKMIAINRANAAQETGKENADASSAEKETTSVNSQAYDSKNPSTVVKTDGGNKSVKPLAKETPVDTTSPVYPEYARTRSEIKTKQVETISSFAEAMKLNKLAQQKKEEEISIRDKAVVMKDTKQRYMQLKKADAIKREADSLDQLSQEKFRTAQHITTEVSALNDKASKLKEKMGTAAPMKSAETATAMNEPVKTQPSNVVKTEQPSTKKETKDAHPVTKNNSEKESVQVAGQKKAIKSATPESATTAKTQAGQKNNSSADSPATSSKEKKSVKPVEKESASVTKKKNEPVVVAAEKTELKKEQPAETKKTEKNPLKIEKPKEEKSISAEEPLAENSKPIITSEALVVPKEQVFNMASVPVYTASNPIPIDPALPDGLVFKVQIGAFHSPLPASVYKNLQPVTGETTRPGWIRYCVGLFKAFEPANMLKAEMKSNGYKDAFVVAYYNGKRIELSQAYDLIRKAGAGEKKLYASASEKETSILRSFKITGAKVNNPKDEDVNSFYGTSSETSAETSGNVEYAVQVGVYKSSKIPAALVPLTPLQTEQIKNGLVRFTTGRYALYASADSSKQVAIRSGVKDAFIVAYKNGSRISIGQARPATISGEKPGKVEQPVKQTIAPSGVSTENSALLYKVQVGAFRQKLSADALDKLGRMAAGGMSQETTSSGLTIFYSGSYADVNAAMTAKSEIVSKGIKDAFVVSFTNGKKARVSQAVSGAGH